MGNEMTIKIPQISMYNTSYAQYQLLFGTNKSQRVEDLENLQMILEWSGIEIENCLELFSGAGETAAVWGVMFPDVTLYETDLFGASTGRTNFDNFFEGDVVDVLKSLVSQNKVFDLIYIPHNSLASNFVSRDGKSFDFAKVQEVLSLVSQLTDVFVYGNKDVSTIDPATGLVEISDTPATFAALKAMGADEDETLVDPQWYVETYQKYNPVNSIYEWIVQGGIYDKGKVRYELKLPKVYKFGTMHHVTSMVESLSSFKTRSVIGYDQDSSLRYLDTSATPTHSELTLGLFLFIDQ